MILTSIIYAPDADDVVRDRTGCVMGDGAALASLRVDLQRVDDFILLSLRQEIEIGIVVVDLDPQLRRRRISGHGVAR